MSLPLFNTGLLSQAQPFTVASRLNRAAVEPSPFGVPTRWFIDPFQAADAPFFLQLQRLDRLTFGPEGMPMARWIFYAMAEVPGLIYGFAIDRAALGADEAARLEVPPDYAGPVPISMYIAIPMGARGAWFGHNLASLGRLLPERRLEGLGTVTKALGLKAFGVRRSFGATQWSSRALFIHSRLGPLRLHTAWTPAHSIPQSLTYSCLIDEPTLEGVLTGAPRAPIMPERWLSVSDETAMQELQAEIEGGARWAIVGPPRRDGGAIPLASGSR